MNGKCYVTICTNKRYLKGVLLLNKSLKMASSSFPLLCVVPNTIEQEVLSVLRDKRINVKQIDNGIILNENILESNRNSFYAHWNNTFFKFYVFSLTEFKKIVFLDADMIVINNIDALFEKPHMTACSAGRLYPGNEKWRSLNSGIMVIEPDPSITRQLIDLLNKNNRDVKNIIGDQDIINKLYSDWPNQNGLHLSEHYNLFYMYVNYYADKYGYSIEGEEPIRIIHYVGIFKPWMIKSELPLQWRVKEFISRIKHINEMLGNKHSVKQQVDVLYKMIEMQILVE